MCIETQGQLPYNRYGDAGANISEELIRSRGDRPNGAWLRFYLTPIRPKRDHTKTDNEITNLNCVCYFYIDSSLHKALSDTCMDIT